MDPEVNKTVSGKHDPRSDLLDLAAIGEMDPSSLDRFEAIDESPFQSVLAKTNDTDNLLYAGNITDVLQKEISKCNESILRENARPPVANGNVQKLLTEVRHRLSSSKQPEHTMTWPHHSASLQTGLEKLFTASELCDLSIKVQDGLGASRVFKAHKVVLGSFSVCFRRMITKRLAEHKTADVRIDLNEDPDAFGQALEFMYTGRMRVTPRTLGPLWKILDKFEITGAMESLMEFVMQWCGKGETGEQCGKCKEVVNDGEHLCSIKKEVDEFFCDDCQVHCSDRSALDQHRSTAHGASTDREEEGGRTWRCIQCSNAEFGSCGEACSHIGRCNDPMIKCSVCQVLLFSERGIREHSELCRNEGSVGSSKEPKIKREVEDDCFEEEDWEPSPLVYLAESMLEEEPEEIVRKKRGRPRGSHRELKSVRKKGRKAMESNEQLSDVKADHGNNKKYLCSLCGRTLTGLTAYNRHQVVHTGARPFACEVCGKSFTQNQRLTVHKRTHTGERPYLCSLCGKTFTESCKLKRHLTRVHRANKDGTELVPGQPVVKNQGGGGRKPQQKAIKSTKALKSTKRRALKPEAVVPKVEVSEASNADVRTTSFAPYGLFPQQFTSLQQLQQLQEGSSYWMQQTLQTKEENVNF